MMETGTGNGKVTGADAQVVVWESVRARGYRGVWSMNVFLARQVCKLVEELTEVSDALLMENRQAPPWLEALRDAGRVAKMYFDDPDAWQPCTVDVDVLMKELADVQVVVLAIAAELDWLTRQFNDLPFQGFDVVEAAVDKATADVARGVR